MPAHALSFPPASPPSTSSHTPTPSTPPLCTLRVQVLSARNLAAKDRNGKSDPFVIVSLPGSTASNHQSSSSSHTRTTVKPKTLDPVWTPEEATFNFPVLPDWFGPNFAAVASDDIDSSVVRAALQHTVASRYADHHSDSAPDSGTLTPDAGSGKFRPRLSNLRSASSKKLTATASKLLVPVRLGAAGARVVGRQMPRPMRIRRRLNGSASQIQTQMQSNPSSASLTAAANADAKPPRGSIQLDASNGMVSSLEFVIWDKDRFSGNDYMGECSLLVAQWCRDGLAAFDKAQSLWLPVESSRPGEKCTGELQVKIGFVPLNAPASEQAQASSGPRSWSVDEVYNRLVLASLGSQGAAVRAVPASQSVGTAPAEENFVLDGLSSDSEDEMDDDEEDEGFSMSEGEPSDVSAAEDVHEFDTDDEAVYDQHYETVAGVPSAAATGPVASASQSGGMLAPPPPQSSGGKLGRIFLRNKSFKSAQNSGTATPVEDSSSDIDASRMGTGTGTPRTRRRLPLLRHASSSSSGGAAAAGVNGGVTPLRRPRRRRTAKRGEFAFKAEMGQDIIGIVMMEVQSASDLPRWSNMTHTGFDMDPFAIISFGQKIFRTRVARHTLNPTWNEKLLFHVRRHETNFQAKFAIYDWDRVSSNDYVGGAQISVAQLLDAAPKPDPETGLYKVDDEGILGKMEKFELPLSRVEKDEEVKFKGTSKRPALTIQAKFTPYDALRQRFWRQLALQFDTSDSGGLSRLELSSMLDSLGSTLSTKTLDGFFVDVGKEPEEDELTLDETIRALEKEVQKPWERKRKAALAAGATAPASGTATPGEIVGKDMNQDMDFTGADAPRAAAPASGDDASSGGEAKLVPPSPPPHGASSSSASSSTDVASSVGGQMRSLDRDLSGLSMVSSTDSSSATPPVIQVERDDSPEAEAVEQVVRLQSCPLCHMPRLSNKGERDIITHLAVCASQDWRRVESLTVRNYVTATQAQRKWYTKVVNKISQGNYSLGANSANIIVQDRRTGELMEEKMQVYVRLGIRLLYQGARSRMEGARVKKMLKNMSVKQGVKFDSSSSAREIAGFIHFHNLDTDEIREPLESFKTFNEFFYRKLKPDARPNDEPDNPKRLVSGADCRMMAFETVKEATRVWIKGREFSIARLVGDAKAELAEGGLERYEKGGALAILRLAPQDYHRFHCPADAVVGKPYWITGQYYTVNPMAIRSAIDVYGENIRVVVPFHSDEFGLFFAVCIGAMMVGSTVLTVKQGDRVKRGDEFGYFKFGGSTIVLVFEEGRVEWDRDLVENGERAVETLVRVGMGVGRATAAAADSHEA